MKEGNESQLKCVDQRLNILLVNYTGYQNSRLVHKQQPTDNVTLQTCGGTKNNLFKTTTTGIQATTFLKRQQFTEERRYYYH